MEDKAQKHKKPKNRLTNCSYFCKRLRDSGYEVERVFDRFSQADSRSWMVVVDPGNASVFITCYVNWPTYGEETFELYDGGQYIPGGIKLKTSSIEVVIEYLVRYNINNKRKNYNK